MQIKFYVCNFTNKILLDESTIKNVTKICNICSTTDIGICKISLRDCAYLPCAKGTRQRPVYTRQSVCRVQHTVNNSRQTTVGKELVCRVLNLGHTANTLPCALLDPRQNKVHRRNPVEQPVCRVP